MFTFLRHFTLVQWPAEKMWNVRYWSEYVCIQYIRYWSEYVLYSVYCTVYSTFASLSVRNYYSLSMRYLMCIVSLYQVKSVTCIAGWHRVPCVRRNSFIILYTTAQYSTYSTVTYSTVGPNNCIQCTVH